MKPYLQFWLKIFIFSDCSCEWNDPIPNRGVYLNASHTINDTHPGLCKKACEQETRFKCVSIEYRRGERFCHLNEEDRNSQVLIEKRWVDYYDMKCTGR